MDMEIFAQLALEGHICSEYLCLDSEGGKFIGCWLRALGLPVLKVFCRCLLHFLFPVCFVGVCSTSFFLSVKLERVPVWKKNRNYLKSLREVGTLGALMNPGLQRMRMRRVEKGVIMGSAAFAFLANFLYSSVTAP